MQYTHEQFTTGVYSFASGDMIFLHIEAGKVFLISKMPSGIYIRKEETKRRLSEARRNISPETREKMRQAKLGKKHTPEQIEKIRAGNLGKKMPPYSLESREKMRQAKLGKKCSVETRQKMSISHKGELAPNWKGGITPINLQIRASLEYRLWREAVFKRDNYTCQECQDKRGGNLNAHHKKPFAFFPELRFAIDNGITLCESCHQKTETFGNRINNNYNKYDETKIVS